MLPVHELCGVVARKGLLVTSHSHAVTPGCVFVALPAPLPRGTLVQKAGGERFVVEAAAAGAAFVVCDHAVEPAVRQALVPYSSCSVVAVSSARQALGLLLRSAFAQYGPYPKVIGLTGTNGKTTTTYLLEYILSHAGKKVGILGTVAYRWPGYHEDAPLTTPGCVELHSLLSRMGQDLVDYAVMEVSSHALDQDRVAGIDFDASLLTNVTQDHLDYHPDMEHYFQAKARLFRPVCSEGMPKDEKVCVCNADDAFGLRLLEENPQAIGFGLRQPHGLTNRFLHGTLLDHAPGGLHLGMQYEGQSWELRVPLVGTFNAMNLLSAQAVALGLGFSSELLQGFEDFSGVPGRMQHVPNALGVNVFVDYAHTPDALINVLETLQDAGFKRIITVFGCGGDRDARKRPLMGEAVARYSDIAIVTSDNPRTENPESIIAAIRPGLQGCPVVYEEPERGKALLLAVQLARPGDALLVAGKGHEKYQVIGTEKIAFDDVEELLGVFNAL